MPSISDVDLMTYTRTLYQSYQDYLEDEDLSPDGNYRLLSTGELIEVSAEDDLNLRIAIFLLMRLSLWDGGSLEGRVRNGNKELQVLPVGDQQVNRKPDVMVMRPEHLEIAKQAILLEMAPPLWVAEVVSPGGEASSNYQRDYVWKRQQYEALGILEFWIVDPHREKVTVLTLMEGAYQEKVYAGRDVVKSTVFQTFEIDAASLLAGTSQGS
jgi:Uma2 family endonuclease